MACYKYELPKYPACPNFIGDIGREQWEREYSGFIKEYYRLCSIIVSACCDDGVYSNETGRSKNFEEGDIAGAGASNGSKIIVQSVYDSGCDDGWQARELSGERVVFPEEVMPVLVEDAGSVYLDCEPVVSERTLANREKRRMAKERKARKRNNLGIDNSRQMELNAIKMEAERLRLKRAEEQLEISRLYKEKQEQQLEITKLYAEKQRQLQVSKSEEVVVSGDVSPQEHVRQVRQKELSETWTMRKIAENKLAILKSNQILDSWDDSVEGFERRKEQNALRFEYSQTLLGEKMRKVKEQTERRALSEVVAKQKAWVSGVTGTPSTSNSDRNSSSIWSGSSLGSRVTAASGVSLVPEELLIEANKKIQELADELNKTRDLLPSISEDTDENGDLKDSVIAERFVKESGDDIFEYNKQQALRGVKPNVYTAKQRFEDRSDSCVYYY